MTRQHVRSARTPGGTVVRLRPRTPLASVQGTLALEIAPRHVPPAYEVADRAPLLHTAPLDAATDAELRRDLEAWAGRFAQAAVEIVGGDRPASQLVRWTTGEVHADLTRRALLVSRAGGHQPGAARVQPVRPKVATVHARLLGPEAAEVCVRVRYGPRSRAVAARFEQRQDRWLCTALEFA